VRLIHGVPGVAAATVDVGSGASLHPALERPSGRHDHGRTRRFAWAIARRRLGDRAKAGAIERQVLAIWNANSRRIGTGDPNLISAGQRLRIPRS
jgi:hypothetical protein